MPEIWFLNIDLGLLIDEFNNKSTEFISFQRSFSDLVEIIVLLNKFKFFKMVLKFKLIHLKQKLNSIYNLIKRFNLYKTFISINKHCTMIKNSFFHFLYILINYFIKNLIF